ncbi:hypothetical protein M2R47_09425, partial [Moraxella sp. Tifton1]|uniref:hypothetical protein n=1 Tax=Moraxella oculi TaxID=2940516 RepID=UPI0020131531
RYMIAVYLTILEGNKNMSVKNKMLVIAPFLISIAVSIELDRKYYFDIYEFFMHIPPQMTTHSILHVTTYSGLI